MKTQRILGEVTVRNTNRNRATSAMMAAVAALEKSGRGELADDLFRAAGHFSVLYGCVHGVCILADNLGLCDQQRVVLEDTLKRAELNS